MSNRASILCSVGLMCQVSAACQGMRASRIPSARYATLACIGMLQSLPAFASKEGAAVADAVQVIVWIVLVAFIACTAGGVVYGVFKASQGGESVLKGSARGLLKGLIAFVVVAAASMIVLTAVGVLWVAFSFLYIHVLNPAAGQ